MKRFQECNFIIKIWRYRYYLLIPIKFFYFNFIKSLKVYQDEFIDNKVIHTNNYQIIKNKQLWKLLIGTAQSKMNWYYTMDEVKMKLR